MLYDVRDYSDTEQDVAASGDEVEDKLLHEQRHVHFKKDTIKESASPNGFKRVGGKKPSAREENCSLFIMHRKTASNSTC